MKLSEVEVGDTVTGPLGRRIKRLPGRHGDARKHSLIPVAVVERGPLEPPMPPGQELAPYWCSGDVEVKA